MKINKMGTSNPPLPVERDNNAKTEKSGDPFALNLAKSQDSQIKERLTELLDAITEQGKRLSTAPTFVELKSYRELVREFLGEAVGRMYTLQTNAGWDRQGRKKMFSTIKQIDDTLAGLTEDVRIGQERQLKIMNKLDAIRGMLVDLYM
ncbi:hypothetical protein EV210_11823 [Anaerospora hongkongensis]|uniref:DUF327 family protein n=1 Tax=Anaerospora hongkongensis TaxID=244830 RepID=A0A4R1PPA4_9FIRM|nr:YaaR family protein [Anaerospora hongkongensis]TCL33250.1 hypothetical protein EV210_11823 [Anaerospora hongkongensis]